jgi:hypothetical protein
MRRAASAAIQFCSLRVLSLPTTVAVPAPHSLSRRPTPLGERCRLMPLLAAFAARSAGVRFDSKFWFVRARVYRAALVARAAGVRVKCVCVWAVMWLLLCVDNFVVVCGCLWLFVVGYGCVGAVVFYAWLLAVSWFPATRRLRCSSG